MRFLKNSVGFMAVFCMVPAAFALTSRASMVGNAASARVPTISHFLTSSSTTSSSSSTTSSTLLQNAECIEAYTDCMKGADACGPNFEECTNKVLFHGKMPQCLGTLAQCASAGVNSLFGTSTVSALSNVASTNSYGEVTNYTYPTDGSVLGQLITAAAISNRYDTSTCVRRYTSCLKKDSVCGNDFELCTTNSEFRKQRVFCDSTLARCQSDGLIELLGSASTTATPSANSRIGEMIAEGAALAAVNAVSTCYKVIDQCILGACATNPYKCYEKATETSVKLVDSINNGGDATAAGTGDIATLNLPAGAVKIAELVSTSSISSYIRNSCQDTIGGNKYCYATFLGNGQMPTSSQLSDEDNQAEIYEEAYNARMNSGMKAKIAELVNQYDTKAKNKCVDTIKSCVMRVCGSGSGAACYSEVFGSGVKSINKSGTWDDLKTGCAAVVNTDLYCKYAAENPNTTGTYNYTYVNADAFETLFPEYEEGGSDPIGVIAALNASLATSYSDAAIAQMKKQCQSVATSCVRSLCGENYQSCYRNRTDVYSNLTNTGNTAYDKSMNRVGGVLDYTVVLGLCLDTVKSANVCEEHLAIEVNKLNMQNRRNSSSASSWGGASSVRDGWIDAGSATHVEDSQDVVDAYDENGNKLCTSKTGDQGPCDTVDAAGNLFNTPVKITYSTYVQSQAASTLFKDLIYDLEKEAQAKYNAALTKEQSMCIAANNGGIMGNRDSGSTYMWVKLKSNKVPTNYSTAGLTTKQFVASNDLYNSFCRVRITMQSDDKKIQDVLRNGADWSTAYFATGDTFTCGSWIPESALVEIAEAVAKDATADKAASQKRTRTWLTVLGGLGSTAGGVALGESIRQGNILGGLTGLGDNSSKTKSGKFKQNQNACKNGATEAVNAINTNNAALAKSLTTSALTAAEGMEIDKDTRSNIESSVNAYVAAATDGEKKTAATDGEKKTAATAALNSLKSLCDNATEPGKSESSDGKKAWITGVSTVVTGAVGTILVNKAVRDIQQSTLDAEQKAAYEEWMNSVGKHLTCYVGDEEIEYGAVATITLD